MGTTSGYTDEQLRDAVAAARSWRGVLRHLGMASTSSSAAIRSVRDHASRVGISSVHFTGARRWSDDDLTAALAVADSWPDAAARLGLLGGSSVATVKRHAARLGLDIAHLTETRTPDEAAAQCPWTENLRRAGPLLAAAWFTMCGWDVSWPLEPCRYDLLVTRQQVTRRVQVKTTTSRPEGAWQVFLSTSRRERKVYAPDEIDDFFVIDGDMEYYLIPIEDALGLHAIMLRGYEGFRVVREPCGDVPV